MKRALIALTLPLAFTAIVAAAPQTRQPGGLSTQTQTLRSEILISSLATPDLTREITAERGTFEHKSEVARGGPVAAVVRVPGCQKDGNSCRVNADVLVYRPDGAVFHEVRNLDLPLGRGAVPLRVDAQAPTGVYRLVVTLRDLQSRRFARVERQFGVK